MWPNINLWLHRMIIYTLEALWDALYKYTTTTTTTTQIHEMYKNREPVQLIKDSHSMC